ncbi:hypothetical protein MMS61_29545, partial [Escherichia coli]|nr:hypothetical protein [Escherichia coli]
MLIPLPTCFAHFVSCRSASRFNSPSVICRSIPLSRRGEADNKGAIWWLTQAGESEPVSPVPKVTAQMLTEAIEQHG